MKSTGRPDFAVHDMVLTMQSHVLSQVLSPITLSRLLDAEMKTPADQDAFTAAELLESLTASIFRETEKLQAGKFTNRAPAISSLRRNLQQQYFEQLADLAMGNSGAPSDCQTVAATELKGLQIRLSTRPQRQGPVGHLHSRSHLTDLSTRIRKVLDARINLQRP